MEVVLVNLGVFQEYIMHTIHQVWLMGNRHITILCETDHIGRLREFSELSSIPIRIVDLTGYKTSPMMEQYRLTAAHDPNFRHNFWNYAWQRFIILYGYMNEEKNTDIVHIENDIAVYICFDLFLEPWRTRRVWLTMDSDRRCIPGMVYFRDAAAMKELLFQEENMAENDMVTLRNMYDRNKTDVGRLPISPEDDVSIIFDAAAMGQYLGGIDPRNSSWKDTRGYISPDCEIQYSGYQFEWQRHEDDLWYPYIQNHKKQWIPIANLHIHSKRMADFDSRWPFERLLIPMHELDGVENLVQGEKIQRLATMYVGHKEDLEMNPIIRDETSRHFDLNLSESIGAKIWNPPLVFVYTIRLQEFLVRVLPSFVNRCILICHNSDFNIDDAFIESIQPFLTDRIIRICTQNLRSMRDQHFWKPLPIGIQNTQWLTSPLNTILYQSPKSRWIYMNFSIHTNRAEREACHHHLHDRIEWARFEKPHADYWTFLSSHHYCICPIGNGVDTHRLWEALLTDTCPIIRRDVFYDRLFLEFPSLQKNVYIMDSWDDVLPTSFSPVSHDLDIHMSHIHKMLTV